MTEGEGDQPTVAQQEVQFDANAALLVGAERQAWTQAVQEVDRIPVDEGEDHQLHIAAARARMELGRDNLQGALDAAKKVDWSGDTKVYEVIVADLVQKGDIDNAIEVARDIKDEYNRTHVFTEILKTQAKNGDPQGALETLRRTRGPGQLTYHGESLYEEVAIAEARAGDIEAAKKIIEEHHVQDNSVDQEVVRAQAKAGNREAVDKYMEGWGWLDQQRDPHHEDVRERDYTLMYIAEGFAESGDFETAKEFADKVEFEDVKARAYAGIASRQGSGSPIWNEALKLDDRSAGLHRFARGFRSISSDVQSELVDTLIKEGKRDRALELASTIDEPFTKNYSYLRIAEAQAKAGDASALDTVNSVQGFPEASLGFIAEARADVAAGFDEYLRSHFGREIPKLPLPDLVASRSGFEHHKRVGAAAIEQWKSFKNYDPATFARLAHGAAEIAHSYMTDEERRAFVRDLADEFRQFRDKGMFDDGQHQAVLKHLSEGLLELEDPASTGHLIETLYKNMGESTGLRLIKSLVESGNAKAGAAGITVLSNPETPEHVFSYLLHKLAQTGYIDGTLPATIRDLDHGGNLRLPEWASRQVLSRFADDLNIQIDSPLLIWTAKKFGMGSLSKEKVDNGLDAIVEQAKGAIEQFEELDQLELLHELDSNEDQRALYFMLKAGRTKYTLIQHYNLGKFTDAVHKGSEIQSRIDLSLLDGDLWNNAPPGWKEAMVNRRRPSDELVWQLEVGSAQKELREQARSNANEVLGFELGWLLRYGLDKSNFGDYQDGEFEQDIEDELKNQGRTNSEVGELLDQRLLTFFFGEKSARKLENIYGETISRALNISIGTEVDAPTIGDFDKAKNALLSQLRQLRKNAKTNNDPTFEKWKDLIEQAEQEDPVIAMRHLLSLLTSNPDYSLHPKGAVAEWTGHLAGLATATRDSQRKGNESRNITLRYLDGKEDFAELLRFADGAQCCFTSENTAGVEMDVGGGWRMRINRDPHWFVFSIEDTPPDATTRVSSGFIFGSLARVNNEPALAINGVYMQKKTDAAVNNILEDLTERFARRLGVRHVLVGGTFGGEFNADKSTWRPAGGMTLLRPRAIRDEYGDPESGIYDDLGQRVNEPQEVPKHCWVTTL